MRITELISETGDTTSTLSGDIATVAFPLFGKKAMIRRAVDPKGYMPKKKTSKLHTVGFNLGESVIYRLDSENPMDDSEILILGGAGRYSFKALRNKARKEASELFKEMEAEHGGAFRDTAHHVKQLTNTLNTIVAAYNELNAIHAKGGVKSRRILKQDVQIQNKTEIA